MNDLGPAQPLVLIVEDEPKIADLLADYLHAHGNYRTRQVHRGDQALGAFDEEPPDLVLLDLMLPGLDGIEVCKQIRARSEVPIIMVTARVDEIDRLLGLELGADDYVCKPFSPREVVARARAVLRRTNRPAATHPGIVIDDERQAAMLDGQDLGLTAVELALLQTLHARPGKVFSRQQLMDRMYPDYRVVSDRAVDTHVKNLRRKLAAVRPGTELIESLYGVGYRFSP